MSNLGGSRSGCQLLASDGAGADETDQPGKVQINVSAGAARWQSECSC